MPTNPTPEPPSDRSISSETGDAPEHEPEPGSEPSSRLARWWALVTPRDHPVAWLAIAGAGSVLAAALSSTAANWGGVSIWQRVAGMLVLHVAIAILGETLRSSVPKTAQALAHLGAALFVPSGISLTAAFGGSWRSCILVGGAVGLVALEVQAHRWRSRWMNGLQVGALTMMMAGVAATVHVPVGLLLGLAAAGVMMTTTRNVESFSLAALTALTPVLALAGRVKFGSGTIAELGANGRSLAWAAPVTGLLAGAVFVQLSRMYKRWQSWLVAAAATSSISGGLIGLAYLQPSPTVAALGAPALLVALELAAHMRIVDRLLPNSASVVRSFNGFVEFFEVITLAVLVSDSFGFRVAEPSYAPLLVAAIGLALGAFRTGRLFIPRAIAGVGSALCGIGALATVSESVWPVAWSLWLGFVVIARSTRNRAMGVLAAVVAPVMVFGELVDAGVGRDTRQGILVALAVVAFGVSASLRKGLTPFDAGGASALLIASLAFERPIMQAMAVTGCGLGLIGLGWFHDHVWVTRLGTVVSGFGLLWTFSLWSGNGLAKYDALSLITVALAVAIEQRFRGRNGGSPMAGPEFLAATLFGSAYLLATAFAEQTSARIGACIAIGIAALAIGVLTKRPAVVVGGAATALGAGLIATWEQLGTLPTWAWLLLGGLALLALAVVVERRRTPAG